MNFVIQNEGFTEDALLTRGTCFLKLGFLEKALNDYNLILANNPLNSDALYSKGHVFFKQNFIESAIICFKQALELNNQDSDILTNNGILEMLYGDKKTGAILLLKAACLGDKEALDKLKILNKNL